MGAATDGATPVISLQATGTDLSGETGAPTGTGLIGRFGDSAVSVLLAVAAVGGSAAVATGAATAGVPAGSTRLAMMNCSLNGALAKASFPHPPSMADAQRCAARERIIASGMIVRVLRRLIISCCPTNVGKLNYSILQQRAPDFSGALLV
jgi:hypothetical protein